VATTLGLLELAAGLAAGVPSLVSSVGEFFIPFTPEWVKDWAIALFDTSDKGVLVGGVVLVSLLLGGLVGRAAATNPTLGTAVFGPFALFGIIAALGTPGTGLVVTAVAVVVAAGAGLGVLRLLLRHAPRPNSSGDGALLEEGAGATTPTGAGSPSALGDPLGRRPFLAASAGLAVATVGAGAAGRALLRDRASRVAEAVGDLRIPRPADLAAPVTAANRLAVDGITPIIVPNSDFYRIDTALQVPLVDPTTWQVAITGMVDNPITLTYEDLIERDLVERYVTLSCVSNEVGGGLVGNAGWWGTLLAPLLEEAGVQPGATQVVGRSVDGWTAGFPTEAAFDGRDAMIAVGMNGAPLPAEHGYPARLVVPGLYGYVSATKWLSEIELTTFEGFDGYWVPRGWSKLGPIKTQSRIDVPADGTRVAAGANVVAGIAWSPGRGIEGVEVRVDDGEWLAATLSAPLSDDAWVQWRAEVELPEGPSFIAVRATNGNGSTQTETVLPPRPDGATGWHQIRVFT
jgi:DMSO/TMAO reductase YedYZ molybdopterin-dependent catalytic subunit